MAPSPDRPPPIDLLTERGEGVRTSSPSATEERILDAALAAFAERGIRATTMSRIATEAGISREWLYRHFANRDALVGAVTRREAVRFMDGLAPRAGAHPDPVVAVTDGFVYAVEFFRDHELLQRMLATEPEAVTAQLIAAEPLIQVTVTAASRAIEQATGLAPERSTLVAEALVRLVLAVTLVPRGRADLHEPEALRRLAATVVPPLLAAEPAG